MSKRSRTARRLARTQVQPNAPVVVLQEEWGELVPRESYPWNEIGGFGSLNQPRQYTTIDDRTDGKYLPFYETEIDLAYIRAQARNSLLVTPIPVGALESLANYTFGDGFTITAQSDEGAPEGLVADIQREIDDLLDHNDVPAMLDRELDARARQDGEALIHLKEGRHTELQIIEPDQLTQPADARPIEDWLGCGDRYVSSWTFGVHTPAGRTYHPLGYHVVYDGRGADWDYIPADRMEHWKRNVSRNAKRGVSDFVQVVADMEREAKLRRNTAEGSAIQAAIAFIREHVTGASQDSIGNMVVGNARTDYQQARKSGSRTVRVEKFNPGTVKDIPNGMKYHAGPLGQSNAPNFIGVAQYVLRIISVRWNIPEFIISGDASNGNYASSSVAMEAFVRSRRSDQAYYKRCFSNLVWKALKLAHKQGRFDRHGMSWDEIEVMVDVKVDAPEIEVKNPVEQRSALEAEIRMGLTSKRTAAAELRRDYDAERENITADGDAPLVVDTASTGVPADPVGGEYAEVSRLQWKRNRKAIEDVLSDFATGATTEAKARVFLRSLGLGDAQIDELIADAADGKVDQPIAESSITREELVNAAVKQIWEAYP